MTPDAEIVFVWSEDLHDSDGRVTAAMIPMPRFRKIAESSFTIDRRYRMEVFDEASSRSRRHYFASLREAWLNLPEDVAERFPTSEHLRKWALIKAGYYNEKSFTCASKAEAQRLMGFVRPEDGYALVTRTEAVVSVFTAKSQSVKAMGKDEFQQSKEKVLDIVAGMVGVTRQQLREAAVQH